MSKNNNELNKAGRSFFSMFRRLFVQDKLPKNILEEEALRTPGKTILYNLLRKKLFIVGCVGFILMLLFTYGGSLINPVDLHYNEFTHSNLPPSTNFLNYPSVMNNTNIVKISSGISFSVGLDDKGNLYMWGTEPNLLLPNVSGYIFDVPQEVRNAHIIDVEVGSKHVVALDDQGNFYGWGHLSHGKTEMPSMIAMYYEGPFATKVVQMHASGNWTALLGDDGYIELWGSLQSESSFRDLLTHNNIIAFASGDNNMALLYRNGTVGVSGLMGTEFFENIPPELTDGSVTIVDIVATNRNVLALDDQGGLHLWGSAEHRLDILPDITGTPIHISAGYKNFVVVTDDGSVIVWGSNELGQLNKPSNLEGTVKVFVDYFQFYAMDENGRVVGAWGNQGYLFGTDHLGRDIFSRLMHGGIISIQVGVIAAIIGTLIGTAVGLISGFTGKWVDHVLMRFTDVIGALPFLPIVVTLGYIMGNDASQEVRVYTISIVIGVLSWSGLARLVRAQLLLEREKDFVLAARALGIKQRNIMIRHVLPTVVNFIIVSFTLAFASGMLTEAALSFLGFGVREPTPSWGNMLTTAQESAVIQHYWWRWIIPALFVVTTAFSINLIGDALRDAMDPKASER